MVGAPEISTDGFHPYKNAIRDAFNGRAHHGVIVKTYSVTNLAVKDAARRYSPAEVVRVALGRTIEITFPESSGLHRVRNFAEELSMSLGELGSLPMEQADHAKHQLRISNIPKRKLGRCRQLIERLLVKHLMELEAVIRQVS